MLSSCATGGSKSIHPRFGAEEHQLPPYQADSQIRELVERLDYARFKETIFELSKFQGRGRNSVAAFHAMNWIETQLQRLGYTQLARDTFATANMTNTNLHATKVGTRFPDEMYIVSANIDGGSFEGADDNASGCALVLELARVLSSPEVQLDRSVRFIFFSGPRSSGRWADKGGMGSIAYANDLSTKNGREIPPESGKIPEPRWLGVIHHQMVLFDHGWPFKDHQIAEADIDVEYSRRSKHEDASAALARVWERANAIYASRFPLEISDRMVKSDAYSFRDYVASINVSENRREREIDQGSNPFRGTDYFGNYSEADFTFGFNVVQTSMAGVAYLAGVRVLR